MTSSLEHPGVLGPVALLRSRGVEVDIVDIGDGGDDGATLAGIEAVLTPRTRAVVISHVAWVTGAVLPVQAISELAHANGSLLVIDGAQSVGAIPVAFGESGADAYAVAAQKWLLGPEGMGALAVTGDLCERLVPRLGGWLTFERQAPDWQPWPDARRFEWSNFHRPSVIGMARSLSWLSMYVGWDWIHARGTSLARRAAARLAQIDGVAVLTPTAQMATLVTFRIHGWTAAAALEALGSRAFAILRTIDSLDALRISVGFFTSEEELERFAETVELLARHTPETIPPRRTLAILGEA